MPKFTVIEGSAPPDPNPDQPTADGPEAADALSVLKDYLNISDPAVQQAVAELIAALARLQH